MKYLASFLVSLLLSISFCSGAQSGRLKGNEKPDPHGELFVKNCTGCHDLTMVEEAHRTKTNAEMKQILLLHKDKPGFQITKKDLKALLRLY